MAMDGERSRSSSPSSSLTATTMKPLHNFDLPRGLKWGNQRFLRCIKVNSNDEISERRRTLSSSPSPTPIPTPSVVVAGGRGGSAAAEIVSVSVSNGSKSIAGKRKGKDKFDDDPIPSRRRGSEQGFNFKLPPLPFQRPSSSSATESFRKYRSSETGGDGGDGGGGEGVGDGIAAVRKKLMNDLQTAADKMKVAILGGGLYTEEKGNRPLPSPAVTPAPKVPTTVTSSATAVRPWNLRTRRAACMEPPTTPPISTNSGFFSRSPSIGNGYRTSPGSMASTTDDVNHDVVVSSSSRAGSNKSSRLRSGVSATAAAATPIDRENERPKFSVSLSQREIEQDFFTFANRKPARRPRKRDKNVQRRLDTLFPGLWLSEITADMYKVQETHQQQ